MEAEEEIWLKPKRNTFNNSLNFQSNSLMKKKEKASNIRQPFEYLDTHQEETQTATKISRIDQQDTFNTVDLDDYEFSSILCKQNIKYADQSDTEIDNQNVGLHQVRNDEEQFYPSAGDDFQITPGVDDSRQRVEQNKKYQIATLNQEIRRQLLGTEEPDTLPSHIHNLRVVEDSHK